MFASLRQGRPLHFKAVDELRGQDASGANRFALVLDAFVNDRQPVALAQVAMEIDIGRKNVRDLGGDGVPLHAARGPAGPGGA